MAEVSALKVMFKRWNKGGMLMRKTWKLSEIKNLIDPKKEAVIVDGDYVYILAQKDDKLLKLFVRARYRYREIDIVEVVSFIAKRLKDGLDVEEFLKELLLLKSPPEHIMELHERLQAKVSGKEPSVQQKPQCAALMVGGKRGRPFELVLVA